MQSAELMLKALHEARTEFEEAVRTGAGKRDGGRASRPGGLVELVT